MDIRRYIKPLQQGVENKMDKNSKLLEGGIRRKRSKLESNLSDSSNDEDPLHSIRKEGANENEVKVFPTKDARKKIDSKKFKQNVDNVVPITPDEFFNKSKVSETKKSEKGNSKAVEIAESLSKACKELSASNSKRASKEDIIIASKRPRMKEKKSKACTPMELEPNHSVISADDNDFKEKAEKRKKSFMQYKNRPSVLNPGCKEIPIGASGCFKGITFVVTGILESLDRDQCKELIEKYGGKMTTSVSKNTTYILVGQDAGVSKLGKAEKLGTQKINEDEFLKMIADSKLLSANTDKLPLANNSNNVKQHTKSAEEKDSCSKNLKVVQVNEKADSPSSRKLAIPAVKADLNKEKCFKHSNSINFTVPSLSKAGLKSSEQGGSALWIEKYQPKSFSQLIGQQGAKSPANKLIVWLRNWSFYHGTNSKQKYGAGSVDDGKKFKAALLSGPPGIGKTTTAHLCCKELGLALIDFNASDTRSKNLLQSLVADASSSLSLSFSKEKSTVSNNCCIIMDEIDGMSGNEDRGGIQEIISIIKQSKVPLICICNDRQHPKIRSLANYCFDIRFQRPRNDQIKGAMMTILYKERCKFDETLLNEVIKASGCDIRQVIHNLNMWFLNNASSVDSTHSFKKNVYLNPFEVCRRIFLPKLDDVDLMLKDRSELFFADYSLIPLFVQENYLSVSPVDLQKLGKNKNALLHALSIASDALSYGDMISFYLRSLNNWSLLPTMAMFSAAIPAEIMKGHFSSMVNFPSWLGWNSKCSKMTRLFSDLRNHVKLRTQVDRFGLRLDYAEIMYNSIIDPLFSSRENGISQSVNFMNEYYLLREDIDTFTELSSSWLRRKDSSHSFDKLDPKIKSAFTRSFNSSSSLRPYNVSTAKMSKRFVNTNFDFDASDAEDVAEEEETADDLKNDRAIKVKKPKDKDVKTAKTSKQKTKK